MCMHINSARKDILSLGIKYRITLQSIKVTRRTNRGNVLTLDENITRKIVGRRNNAAISYNCTHKLAPPTNPGITASDIPSDYHIVAKTIPKCAFGLGAQH